MGRGGRRREREGVGGRGRRLEAPFMDPRHAPG